MATAAYTCTKAEPDVHNFDISRDRPDFCIVYGEHGDGCLKGRWVEGFGFVHVHFPKETTREITPDEQERYQALNLVIV
jgi:hypothetical protein